MGPKGLSGSNDTTEEIPPSELNKLLVKNEKYKMRKITDFSDIHNF